MLSNGVYQNEVLVWRLIGASTWSLIGFGFIAYFWTLDISNQKQNQFYSRLYHALLNLSAGWILIKFALANSIAFAAHCTVISSEEPYSGYIFKIIGSSFSYLAHLVSKLIGRGGSPSGFLCWLLYLAAHIASAFLHFLLLHNPSTWRLAGARWQLSLSIYLVAVHALHVIYWSRDVIVFPVVQRHRYFRLKRRLPALLRDAVQNASLAFVLALLTDLLLGHGVLSIQLSAWFKNWLGAAVCSFCWLWVVAVVEVVMSEQLSPRDYSSKDVLGAMLGCLTKKQGTLMLDLALLDFCTVAHERAGAAGAWRRLDVFADDSGERWRLLAVPCIQEMDVLCQELAAALPQGPPKKDGAAMGGKKWNALPLAAKSSLRVTRTQLQALGAARCRYQRTVLCARTLAGFAAASLREDKYGVLQLTQPGLGEVVLCLLSTLHAVQQFAKVLATLSSKHLKQGPWRCQGEGSSPAGVYGAPGVDAAVRGLRDSLSNCLQSLIATFGGEGVTKVVQQCKQQPTYGTPLEMQALLQSLMRGEE